MNTLFIFGKIRSTVLIKAEGLISIKQNFDNTGNADSSAV